MLGREAHARLSYQAAEFSGYLKHQDTDSIRKKSNVLIHEPGIAGILLVGTSGKLIHIFTQKQQYPVLRTREPVTARKLAVIVAKNPHLHLYKVQIPNQRAMLFLVMDDRQIGITIESSTIIAIFLLLILLGLSIKALHYALRRQLVEPVEEVRGIIDAGEDTPENILHKLGKTLPDEAADILDTYEHLQDQEHHLEERTKRILDMIPGCTWNAGANIEYSDFLSKPDNVFRKSSEQLLHTPLWSWLESAPRRQELYETLQQAIKNHIAHLDLAYPLDHVQNADGETCWIGESLYLQYTKGGSLAMIISISNDITERKQREIELLKMQQHARKMEAIGTLVGGIAHEFNNMLAGIVGNVFLLKKELASQPKQTKRLARIEGLTKRAAILIDQMLTFGRKHVSKTRSVALNKIVERIFLLERENLREHVDMSLDMPDELTVLADTARLKQILGSVIDNALDALEGTRPGRIGIRLERFNADKAFSRQYPKIEVHSSLAHITVTDNGCGIAQKYMDRIFDPFFTTKGVGRGTGMGLSMAYGAMESMGGVLKVESSEGNGTTVHLYLPTTDNMEDNSVNDDGGKILSGEGETILIADDEELVREAAREILEEIGYRVITAADGEEAVQRLRNYKDGVDLALLDLIMPRMGGMDAAGHMRSIRPNLPILFITGYDMNNSPTHELRLNHSEIVAKPFRVSVLSQAIRRLLKHATT